MRFKDEVKTRIRTAAFKYLRQLQSEHTKTKTLEYEMLKVQSYLKSSQFSNAEANLLSLLRSRMHTQFKSNFRNAMTNDTFCPLNCNEETGEKLFDTQEHLMHCKKVISNIDEDLMEMTKSSIQYNDIFSNDETKLKKFVIVYSKLLETKQFLVENPGFLDPCTDPVKSCAMDVYDVFVY